MSQQELGRRAGLPMQRISEIERGKRSVKEYERGRIARALGTTESELFVGLGYSGDPEGVAETGTAHMHAMISGKRETQKLGAPSAGGQTGGDES